MILVPIQILFENRLKTRKIQWYLSESQYVIYINAFSLMRFFLYAKLYSSLKNDS